MGEENRLLLRYVYIESLCVQSVENKVKHAQSDVKGILFGCSAVDTIYQHQNLDVNVELFAPLHFCVFHQVMTCP